MIERKVYQCEHCKKFRRKPKIYFSSADTYLHEHKCWYNIKNKTCFTCKNNNRQYNKSTNKSIGCNFNLLKQEAYTLSDIIQKDCEKWEAQRK